MKKKGEPPEEVLETMERAARLTIKDYSQRYILRQVLSKDEISLLDDLAEAYFNVGRQDEAMVLAYALKDYIERKVVDDAGISGIYTSILHGLTNWVGQRGNYDEVIRLCEVGIKRCIEYGAYFSFASMLYNKGYALAMLGRKGEARKYLQEAYYLNRARGKLQSCEINKKFADEQGIEL
jgi:tetratricopeptide (TPR) repeat protein